MTDKEMHKGPGLSFWLYTPVGQEEFNPRLQEELEKALAVPVFVRQSTDGTFHASYVNSEQEPSKLTTGQVETIFCHIVRSVTGQEAVEPVVDHHPA